MEWTEEAISRLRSLWQEGLSTAEIGRRLSITKNAVVGKAHRLTLPPRPSPIRKSDPAKVAKVAEAAAARQAARQASRQAVARVASFAPREAAHPGHGTTSGAGTGFAAPSAGATVTHLRPVTRQGEGALAEAGGREGGADIERAAARPVFTRRSQCCCWPLGEPGTKQFRFCGAEPIPGKPYCTEHAQLAYVKLRDRRDTVA